MTYTVTVRSFDIKRFMRKISWRCDGERYLELTLVRVRVRVKYGITIITTRYTLFYATSNRHFVAQQQPQLAQRRQILAFLIDTTGTNGLHVKEDRQVASL